MIGGVILTLIAARNMFVKRRLQSDAQTGTHTNQPA